MTSFVEPEEIQGDSDREVTCPQCGMPLAAEGTTPMSKGGVTYCCDGCAGGGECTCDSHGHR